MDYAVRPMSLADIPQVEEIEREAFPNEYPHTSYRRDLENGLAHYQIAYVYDTTLPQTVIVGIVGFWLWCEEAHIILIAVRKEYRRQGVGELLLISAIKEAMKLGAKLMTLEVRVSNLAAQSLYSKFGFKKVGLRRGYYSDKEDGYIMTTDPFHSPSFQSLFQLRLKQYQERYHRPIDQISFTSSSSTFPSRM